MKVNQEPLSDEETIELRQLLEACAGASLDFARGVFAAIATAPTRKDITDWLPLIVGDAVEDTAQLRRLFSLVMRDFHACSQCLALGVPAVPAPDNTDAITQFSKGYIRVTQADPRWKADMDAFALTVPFAVLSGYVAPESLRALQPELAANPEEWCAKQRQALADTTASLYTHWSETRIKQSTVTSAGKVGRNELCPCGSGKKFKKCCAA